MKNYKYPKTKKLINQLKPFISRYAVIRDNYYKEIAKLEKEMEKLTGIPEIGFFFCDGECVGIGNAERTMELIHLDDFFRLTKKGDKNAKR